MRSLSLTLLFSALLASAPLPATAEQKASKGALEDPIADPMLATAGFLSAHPDLRNRLLGLEKRKQNNHEEAFRFFQRAAYYADKPSQGMVAEMLWLGQGTAQDKALAYAWMDLAAERGYRTFTAVRERYWDELSESERERAIAEGEAVYAKYGDDAAQPRIATVLRRERRNTTGSRTGSAANLKIYTLGPGGEEVEIEGSKFYDSKYWDPQQYQAWHDSIWMNPRTASVEVGDVSQATAEETKSRIPPTVPQQDADEPETDDDF